MAIDVRVLPARPRKPARPPVLLDLEGDDVVATVLGAAVEDAQQLEREPIDRQADGDVGRGKTSHIAILTARPDVTPPRMPFPGFDVLV